MDPGVGIQGAGAVGQVAQARQHGGCVGMAHPAGILAQGHLSPVMDPDLDRPVAAHQADNLGVDALIQFSNL